MQAAGSSSTSKDFVLLIVDSIMALVTPVLGAGNAMQGHALMIVLARQLRACAQQFTLAVLVSNSLLGGEVCQVGLLGCVGLAHILSYTV